MPISYPQVLAVTSAEAVRTWGEQDAILYALGLGFGADGAEPAELAYVYERHQLVVPTFAVILQRGLGVGVDALGVDYRQLVHGEQEIILHGRIPPSGAVRGSGRVAAVYDKGDKGALVVLETSLADAESGAPLAVCRTTLFARGDGHCGAPRDGLPEPTPRPAGEPDATILLAVPANQALIYRLSGDLNPLHADPEVAGRAGFPSPILHGLSTYGMVCRALSRSFEDLDLTRLRRLQARFSAPVYPGEDLAFDLWRDGHWVDFEVRAVARGVVVLKGGRAAFAGDDPLSPSGTFQS